MHRGICPNEFQATFPRRPRCRALEAPGHPPIVVYVRQLLHDEPRRHVLKPRDAFAITVKPDELLHLVMDVRERTAG